MIYWLIYRAKNLFSFQTTIYHPGKTSLLHHIKFKKVNINNKYIYIHNIIYTYIDVSMSLAKHGTTSDKHRSHQSSRYGASRLNLLEEEPPRTFPTDFSGWRDTPGFIFFFLCPPILKLFYSHPSFWRFFGGHANILFFVTIYSTYYIYTQICINICIVCTCNMCIYICIYISKEV